MTSLFFYTFALCLYSNEPLIVDCSERKTTYTHIKQNEDGYHPLCDMYYTMRRVGGKQVCKLWRGSMLEFVGWALRNGWKQGDSLMRIDSDQQYGPCNCIFIS